MKCSAQLSDMVWFVVLESFLEGTYIVPNIFSFFLKSSFKKASVTPNLLVFCLFLLNLFHKPLCLSLCVGVFLGLS